VRSDIHGWALSEEAIQFPNHRGVATALNRHITGPEGWN
ncbi:hypothetical protein ACZ87_02677, partial [Candidatus Erwinia dacicola]